MADPTVIIDLEPDWDESPEVSYSFQTAIQGTPYFVEQRRPIAPSAVRRIGCKYVFENERLQYARNLFLYGSSKLCCIPVYSEPIQAAAITQGASAITATTDLTYLWNIQNCSYLVILDFVTGQSEMLAVASVAGQTINFSSAIVNSWTAAQTIIYPAIAGMLSSIKGVDFTSTVGKIGAEFEEIAIGEEATKVWVGLEEQICYEGETILTLVPFLEWTELDLHYVTENPSTFLTPQEDGFILTNVAYAYTVMYSFANPYGELPIAKAKFRLTISGVSGTGADTPVILHFQDTDGDAAWISASIGTSGVSFYAKSSTSSPSKTYTSGFPLTKWFEMDFTVAGIMTVRIATDENFTDVEATLVATNTGLAANPIIFYGMAASLINTGTPNYSMTMDNTSLETAS